MLFWFLIRIFPLCWSVSQFSRWINHFKKAIATRPGSARPRASHWQSSKLNLRPIPIGSQTLCDAGLIGMLEWLRAIPRKEKQRWKKINKCISKNRWVSRTEGEIAQGECWWVAVAVTWPQDWTIIIKFPCACQVWPETCWRNHDSKSCTV